MNYCGIDLSSKSSDISIINGKGKQLGRREIDTEASDIGEALKGFGELKVIIEAHPLAETVAQIVEELGHIPVIIDARAAKNLMDAMKKTDRRDAQTLAEIGRCGWYVEVHRKSADARQMRSILQARQALLKSNKALASSIRGLLRSHGIRLGKVSKCQFVVQVKKVTAREAPGLLAALSGMLDAWVVTRERAEQIKQALVKACKQDEISAYLESAPGVGPLISTAYRATIDDPHRFKRGDEVSDYLGLAPRVYQSGEVEHRGRITKQGDALLRSLLVEGAHVLLTKGRDCALKRWGLSLEKRKGSAKAKVAVARKLAVLLWRLWKDEKMFEAFEQAV
jgi:transposase